MTRRESIVTILAGAGFARAARAGFRGARYSARRTGSRTDKDKRKAAAGENAVEFQVTAEEPFPVRALDPVLHVGGMEVRDYRYGDMENRTLIFTCYEPGELRDDAPVYLQYENDERTRTDLPAFRWRLVQ